MSGMAAWEEASALTQKSEQYVAERKAHDVTRAALAEACVRISALIAECETAKAELAEAVKVLAPFAACVELLDGRHPHVNLYDEDGTAKVTIPKLAFVSARAFIAKHNPPPQPVPVGEEK